MSVLEEVRQKLLENIEQHAQNAPEGTKLDTKAVLKGRVDTLRILAEGYEKLAEENEPSEDVLRLLHLDKDLLDHDGTAVAMLGLAHFADEVEKVTKQAEKN